jgi:broad specificity phosphatase PhoE
MLLPFDGHKRRRIYLVRHGQAAATQKGQSVYADNISLTTRGIEEARAMREHLKAVKFDAAFSSDIRRSQETAAIILEAHGLAAESSVAFTELRGDVQSALAADIPLEQKLASFAYLMWDAHDPALRFLGGDVIGDYLIATGQTLSKVVRETQADTILIVSHSGFQRAALCWALNAAPIGMAAFEQDSCCLNVLDIDVAADGRIVRKHVRLSNFTPLDLVKQEAILTDGEQMAMRLHGALSK